MAAFPSYPKLLFAGFAEQPDPGAYRSEMESGPPKQLKAPSRVLIKRPVRYHLQSNADYISFKAFVETTINRVDWFDWTDPVSNTVKSARILGGQYDAAPMVPDLSNWEVSFMIETWA